MLPGGRPPGFGGPPGGEDYGGGYMTQQTSVPEEAWLMRFIDVTTLPGYTYKYRVRLKAYNPNYGRPVRDLAIPDLAKVEELQSDWFVIKDEVRVPPEEHVYAAARDERKNRVTEKMPPPSNWDDTWVQIQRWYDFIRPAEFNRAEPLGEWLVADIKATRGQYIGEALAVTLPIWKMDLSMFLFRDNVRKQAPQGALNRGPRRSEPVWTVDLTPAQLLLVDFEGGDGTYPAPRKGGTGTVRDAAEVQMLLMSGDGKLRVTRSAADLANADRVKREEEWIAWLLKVNQDTLLYKQSATPQQQPGFPGGPPGGPGGPGGAPGGSGRGSSSSG
jgi:hypothetical protein